jgi:hypothetical protein
VRRADRIAGTVPQRILAALGIVLVAGAFAAASGANFKAVSSNPGTTITAGIVKLVNDEDGHAILSIASLVPGQSGSATADMTNAGDVESVLRLSAGPVTDTPASPALSAKLGLVVTDLGDPACTAGCPFPVTVYSGKLGGLNTAVVGTLPPEATHRLRFTVSFPDGGPGADNAYQRARSVVDLTWTLAQR